MESIDKKNVCIRLTPDRIEVMKDKARVNRMSLSEYVATLDDLFDEKNAEFMKDLKALRSKYASVLNKGLADS